MIKSNQLKMTLRQGTVYKFACRELINSLEPHFMIVLNCNPCSDEYIVIGIVTSKVDKRKAYIKKTKLPKDTLVEILPSDYSELTLPSAIDCNYPKRLTSQDFEDISKKRTTTPCNDMPAHILEQLIKGVLASPVVSESYKSLLRPPN